MDSISRWLILIMFEIIDSSSNNSISIQSFILFASFMHDSYKLKKILLVYLKNLERYWKFITFKIAYKVNPEKFNSNLFRVATGNWKIRKNQGNWN